LILKGKILKAQFLLRIQFSLLLVFCPNPKHSPVWYQQLLGGDGDETKVWYPLDLSMGWIFFLEYWIAKLVPIGPNCHPYTWKYVLLVGMTNKLVSMDVLQTHPYFDGKFSHLLGKDNTRCIQLGIAWDGDGYVHIPPIPVLIPTHPPPPLQYTSPPSSPSPF